MTRLSKVLAATVILSVAILAPTALARPRIFVGGYFGPVFYGPGFYGWYAPVWYGPYGYPQAVGTVRINTDRQDAQVYIDGAYSGRVNQLKTFPLSAGEHEIELKSPDGASFYQERVTVIAGRTLMLTPEVRS